MRRRDITANKQNEKINISVCIYAVIYDGW